MQESCILHPLLLVFKYKITLAYDGTQYGGWQIQPNTTSVQMLVAHALCTALRAPVVLHGSGRTDAGVHALGQTAHFEHPETIDEYRLLASLNGLLPPDIRILSIESVAEDFHARYSATGKIYHYHLHLDPVMSPFKRLYALHVFHPIDLSSLKKAAEHFIGTHDFTSFANESHQGSAARDPVRTLKRLDIVEEPGGIRLEFEGDGFLYKMVRNIVGTLLDVTKGKISADEIPSIITAKDRRQAGMAAPAHGLFLVSVQY